jgi:CBS domain-containing protein
MNTINQLLRGKGNDVWRIAPDASVLDAMKTMAEREVGALMVMEGVEIVGVISERDYARQVILKGRASADTPVRQIMTSRVVYVSPGQTIEECLALMTDKRVRHLPVLDGVEVVGVVSIGDLVKAVIAEQKFTIEQMERYIGK